MTDSPRSIMLEAICCREVKRRMKRPCGTDGIYCRDCYGTVDDEILPALEKAGFQIVTRRVLPIDNRAAVCEWTKIDDSWATPGCMPKHRVSYGGADCFRCHKRITWKKAAYICDGDEGPSIHQQTTYTKKKLKQ